MNAMQTRRVEGYCKTAAGVWNASVDGSATPVLFDYVSPGNLEVQALIIRIENSAVLGTDDYGSINGGLTNGILVDILNTHAPGTAGTRTRDLLNGVPVKTNAGWSMYASNMNSTTFGATIKDVTLRWLFLGAGKELLLENGDTLRVTIQDDCTPLTTHAFMVKGRFI